jgi:hypothetical protein
MTNTRNTWRTKKAEKIPQPGLSLSHLNLKKTSQKTTEKTVRMRSAAVTTYGSVWTGKALLAGRSYR